MVKQNMCLKMTLLCSFIITFSTKIDSCCDLRSFCLTRDPIRQPDSQPEPEPESELEQLTLAEVVINLDDPGTMDLGPQADIPVIIVDCGTHFLINNCSSKKRKRDVKILL